MEVSVIVPCYNEANNIGECLKALASQTYPSHKYEIVVADGGSKDQTQDIVREFMRAHPNIRLVVETKKGVAAGRNAGIRSAKYGYVAFIDADCEPPSSWLSVLAENFQRVRSKDSDCVGVGGRNIAPNGASDFQKALEIALDSYMGSFGSVQGRQFNSPRSAQSLSTANALYNKDKVVEIGLFDESLKSEAEDAEMNYRLRSKGSKFFFIPDSFVWHKMRPNPIAHFKNMFRYGKGRARLLKRYPAMWNAPYLLPLLFIVGMLLVSLAPFSSIFYMPLAYFPAILSFSIFQCLKKKSPALILHVVFVYILQHFGYAAGQLYGLVNPKVR